MNESLEVNWIEEAKGLYELASDDRNDQSLFFGRCALAMVAAQIATAEAAHRQADALETINKTLFDGAMFMGDR